MLCLISKKPKQTFWNVTHFMVDSWRAAWRDVTLASTWTASASVVNLGEDRGQRQTATQLASSKNNYLCLLHVWVTSPLLLVWLPSLASTFSPAFGFLCHSPEIWDDSFRDLNTSSSVIVMHGSNLLPLPASFAFFLPTDATVCRSLWSDASHCLSASLLLKHCPSPFSSASVPVLDGDKDARIWTRFDWVSAA